MFCYQNGQLNDISMPACVEICRLEAEKFHLI
jgi:Fe-S-cluster-containing dehydrogenase component